MTSIEILPCTFLVIWSAANQFLKEHPDHKEAPSLKTALAVGANKMEKLELLKNMGTTGVEMFK